MNKSCHHATIYSQLLDHNAVFDFIYKDCYYDITTLLQPLGEGEENPEGEFDDSIPAKIVIDILTRQLNLMDLWHVTQLCWLPWTAQAAPELLIKIHSFVFRKRFLMDNDMLVDPEPSLRTLNTPWMGHTHIFLRSILLKTRIKLAS